MGGCCPGPSKEPEEVNVPQCSHLPSTTEERMPLSSPQATASSISTGLLVDTNMGTSPIDTFRPPPPPIPYHANIRHFDSQSTVAELSDNKSNEADQTANSKFVEATALFKDLKEPECKELCDFDLEAEKEQVVELTKSAQTFPLKVEEEDVCPICLEEYDTENPKLTTTCEHEYHLACILEWVERSATCPICDQVCTF